MNERLDPEDVADVLGRIKEEATRIVQAHGGTVNQFVGDEVMALFGLPTAHEDDPRRAVSAALELHRFVRMLGAEVEARLGGALQLHTGMTTGVVLVQPSDLRDGLYRVTGDAVNTAARLLGRAREDEILLGATTQERVAPYFLLEELEPLAVKGKARPVRAFRVLGPAARSSFEASQRRGLTAYTGREAELEALEALLGRVREGTSGFATVVGAPGLGKSRLLHEVAWRARQRGMRVLHGRCDAFGNVAPYQPFLHVLHGALELGAEASPEAARERVLSALRRLEDAEVERRLPYLLHLLAPGGGLPRGLEGDTLRAELAESLRVVLLALSRRQPVVLLLEDWHWADGASDAALRHLGGSLEGSPVALLVNHREHLTPEWGELRPLELRLRPLEPAGTEAVVRACLGPGVTPSASLLEQVHEHTGGNPFFIEEVCRGLAERGLPGEGEGGSRELTRLELPEGVQAVVRARIDRLGVEEAEVLTLAAVVGAEVPVRLLERLVPSPARLPAVLERLEAADMLWRVDAPGETLYRFRHAIIQEVAYETLLLSYRRELHARVGEALEALDVIRLSGQLEALAHHYGRGERHEKAALYAEKAADRAARSYALEEARQQYGRALESLARLEQTPELLRRRVDMAIKWAEVALYKPMARQLAVLEECHEVARRIGYAKGAARCGYWMGWIQYALGNQAEAVWHFERVLPGARAIGDERLVAQLQLNIGQSYAAATEYERALEYLYKGLSPRGTSASQGTGRAYALGYLGMLYGDQGHFERAYPYLREGLAITRTLGRRSLEGSVLTQLGIVQLFQGDWAAVLETARKLRAEAERMGAPFIIAMCRTLEGYARFHLSGGREPLALLREAVRWLEENDTGLILSLNYACLAEALVLL
ncbi:MAG TPA: AAA family ATPase, partial [Myxococcaceae bacterium]|nr:AAA family ATPase [Myxococcaceae bacterium]